MRWAGQSGKGRSRGEGREITEDKTEKRDEKEEEKERDAVWERAAHTHTHTGETHTHTHTQVGSTGGGCLWLTGCIDVDDADCV